MEENKPDCGTPVDKETKLETRFMGTLIEHITQLEHINRCLIKEPRYTEFHVKALQQNGRMITELIKYILDELH